MVDLPEALNLWVLLWAQLERVLVPMGGWGAQKGSGSVCSGVGAAFSGSCRAPHTKPKSRDTQKTHSRTGSSTSAFLVRCHQVLWLPWVMWGRGLVLWGLEKFQLLCGFQRSPGQDRTPVKCWFAPCCTLQAAAARLGQNRITQSEMWGPERAFELRVVVITWDTPSSSGDRGRTRNRTKQDYLFLFECDLTVLICCFGSSRCTIQ